MASRSISLIICEGDVATLPSMESILALILEKNGALWCPRPTDGGWAFCLTIETRVDILSHGGVYIMDFWETSRNTNLWKKNPEALSFSLMKYELSFLIRFTTGQSGMATCADLSGPEKFALAIGVTARWEDVATYLNKDSQVIAALAPPITPERGARLLVVVLRDDAVPRADVREALQLIIPAALTDPIVARAFPITNAAAAVSAPAVHVVNFHFEQRHLPTLDTLLGAGGATWITFKYKVLERLSPGDLSALSLATDKITFLVALVSFYPLMSVVVGALNDANLGAAAATMAALN